MSILRASLIGLGVSVLLIACGTSDKREWMKVNEKYTVQEFRRDYADCSKSGDLDDTCMRGRGWVDVSGREEKPAQQDPRARHVPPPSSSPTRR